MDDDRSAWLLQVYEMTNVAAQESVAELLAGISGFTVDTPTCERGSFVIVDCLDATQALTVYELVMATDSQAELIYTSKGPGRPSPFRTPVGGRRGERVGSVAPTEQTHGTTHLAVGAGLESGPEKRGS
jgi:hypothetical protein